MVASVIILFPPRSERDWVCMFGGKKVGHIFLCFLFLELQALHEMVQQKVVTLLSDPENIVKQTLMENGITRLCVFFGRQKANDVLLSHMITFLNDKNDWHLRGAFFDSIVGTFLFVFIFILFYFFRMFVFKLIFKI